MITLEELKYSLGLLSSETESHFVIKGFLEIADLLFKSFAIKHNENVWLFSDIEFYFYNKYHKDIITHPRNCEAMQWYVNDFGGIDLSFKSETDVARSVDSKHKLSVKPVLTDDGYFGGILIRELRNAKTNERLEGPWACSELFRSHDASGCLEGYPVLIPYEAKQEIDQMCPRYNLKRSNKTTENKAKYILSTYANKFSDEDIYDFSEEFDRFLKANYRYKSRPL